MTEERKFATLFAATLLAARRLQPLLEADDEARKPNMGTELGRSLHEIIDGTRSAHSGFN